MKLRCNCCDGVYNSFDVHFTSACDNKCAHCVDGCYEGLHINKPDIDAIVKTICDNSDGLDDVLFLGGEPCLYLEELIDCVEKLKTRTNQKIYGKYAPVVQRKEQPPSKRQVAGSIPAWGAKNMG